MEIQWPLVLFTLFAGAGGGAMVLLCFADLFNMGRKLGRIGCYVIAVLLVVGGLCSIAHLAQQSHILSVLTNIGSFSGVSLELIGLIVSFVLIVLYWLFCREGQNDTARRVFAVLCGIAGLIFCWILGSSYVIASRPAWDTLLLPCGYWSSGIALGGSLFLSLAVILKIDVPKLKILTYIVLIEIAIQFIVFLIYGITTGSELMVDNGVLFWVCEIVIGCVVAAACLIPLCLSRLPQFAFITFIAILVGALAFRCLMWVLGEGYL
ncbi:MAG: dimethyl sulfoxide reductase anchor subunit, partial [Eggerthellaceae bacterium]|nr:dimethyl sulfoxide reductase anchor subunit [Eggerthellaceae bacterium]